MHVGLPVRSVIPTVDAPVLAVLAGTTLPLTGRRIARLAGASHGAVNAVLARLVRGGLVDAERYGNAIVYTANRDHLAWPAIQSLADLRLATLELLRRELGQWTTPPLTAIVFGSFARGDGDDGSDIDLLVVRPVSLSTAGEAASEQWLGQVEALQVRVRRATGNACQVLDLTLDRLGRHARESDPLVTSWRTDGLHVAGEPLPATLASAVTESVSR